MRLLLRLRLTTAFIASVLRHIRLERDGVRPTDNVRALFVLSVMVEYLLILRRQTLSRLEELAKRKGGSQDSLEIQQKLDEELPLGWAAEAVDPDALRWITARMRMAMEDKPPAWTELQAAINSFTQVVSLLEVVSLLTPAPVP